MSDAPTQHAEYVGAKYKRPLLRQILIQHQRLETGGCLCGFFELGASFADHVMDAYERALIDGRIGDGEG